MTFEIKNRIEKINNGEVPDGYKRTKVGIVPVDWKEISFSDLFTITSVYTDDLNKYPLCSLTIESGIIPKTERYERSYLVKKENAYKIVRPNDFVYNPMNIRFGAVSRYKGKSEISVSGYYDIFTAKINSDSKFMDSFLVSDKMIAYYNKVSIGSLVEKQRVHISQFLNFTIPLPTSGERKKIAEILATQDKIIELKQRKIEELKKLKKYYLSKMFPKRGSNYPEVRFPGFTDPWKQCKLGDCFSERNESMPDGELISVTINDGIKKFSELGRHDNSNEDKSKYKKVCIGDIAYNSMRMWQGASGYSPYEGIVSPAYTVLSPCSGIDSKCLSYQFKLTQMIHAFQVYSQGITSDTWNLKYPAFSQIDICISTDINEQKQIGKFFTQLDQLITLHQRELDEEKRLKKSLMQLLLTGIARV